MEGVFDMAAPSTEKNAVQIVSESHIPQFVYVKPNTFGFGTIQLDSLQRLRDDLNEIPTVKRPPVDIFSTAIGVAVTAVISMRCNWDLSSRVFRVNFIVFIISFLALVCCFLFNRRGAESDIGVINERIRATQKDVQLICQQVAIASEQQEDQAASQ